MPGAGGALLDALTTFPLTPATYADAIQACILTSAHSIYWRLRRHDTTPSRWMPGSDEIGTQDTIAVDNSDDAEGSINGAFRVRASFKKFQKRMNVLKEARINFIARGKPT